ncbi:MAG: aspartate aminotransferase family protein [Ardenticatenales bacterium]|nr:aspartate aminotransferase family protein [Ardenticatenales bacterium]
MGQVVTNLEGNVSFDQESWKLLGEALARLDAGFADLPAVSSNPDLPRLQAVLRQVAERLQDNYPYHHPLYAGQMLKPPHPVARLAYALAMWLNPNNHALDGGRASSAMEKEVVAELAGMFGWETHLGHLTSGGTLANLEALWVAGRQRPGQTVLASTQAHYTHSRISAVLQLPFAAVPTDSWGRMDVPALHARLAQGDVGTVVVTLGTTATGAVDPLPAILDLRARHGFRVHVDAAYGGYFTLADNLSASARTAFDHLGAVDSIAIDPHKHGLQPYGCGCVLFRDPAVGAFYRHDSPYTYFTSAELHLGEISLECSRAGAAAVGLWATHQLLPPRRGGDFAADLEKCRQAALLLAQRLDEDSRFRLPFMPELDIVVWAVNAGSASEASARAQAIFTAAAARNLHLALAQLPAAFFAPTWPDLIADQDHITCLRSCLMKPEHLDWLDAIWQILDEVSG